MKSLLRPIVGLILFFSPATALGQTFRAEYPTIAGSVTGFGSAVAIAGDEILIGRAGMVPNFPMPPMQAGAVHVFRKANEGKWTEVAAVSPRQNDLADGFGSALAADGAWLAVGAPGSDNGRGAVYLFERNTLGTWVERARLVAADGAEGDGFGSAIRLQGGTLLVGAPAKEENTGAVWAWARSATGTWQERGKLSASAITKGDRFGAAISLSGNRALIGAPGPAQGNPSTWKGGQAYVFQLGSGGWVEETRLTMAEDSTVRGLGSAVLLTETGAQVGAPLTDRGAGAVLHFRFEGGTWREIARLRAASPEPRGLFGSSLAHDGDDLLVGAIMSGGGVGAVHVLRRSGTGAWQETQKLTTRGVGIATQLGAALAASNGTAVAGAPMGDFFEGSAVLYGRAAPTGDWREAGVLGDTLSTGLPGVTGREAKCDSGQVGMFDCRDVDLVSFLPAKALGARRGIMLNDMWGWTDSASHREFALVGRLDGTAFVEVTDPANPVYVGELPLHHGAQPNLWRDIKVYRNHAYIVSDGAGPHGVQVFDLTQLLNVPAKPKTFSETAHYDRIHSAHNIAINEESGFAYTVGNSMGGETCGGALHMIDIREPRMPKFAGCFGDSTTGFAKTGYTHDSQCVIYRGPDEKYRGREICFNASETAVGIADVTDKQHPVAISTVTYPNVAYAHQGWLSEDHRYFYLDDEGDELSGTAKTTRTMVFDVADLDDPLVAREFFGTTPASDHNLYVKGHHVYQSNYVAGLRVLDISDPTNPREVGYFDTVPFGKDAAGFAGSWSNYPYFRSGVVGVTSMREGLFLVRYRPQAPIP